MLNNHYDVIIIGAGAGESSWIFQVRPSVKSTSLVP